MELLRSIITKNQQQSGRKQPNWIETGVKSFVREMVWEESIYETHTVEKGPSRGTDYVPLSEGVHEDQIDPFDRIIRPFYSSVPLLDTPWLSSSTTPVRPFYTPPRYPFAINLDTLMYLPGTPSTSNFAVSLKPLTSDSHLFFLRWVPITRT